MGGGAWGKLQCFYSLGRVKRRSDSPSLSRGCLHSLTLMDLSDLLLLFVPPSLPDSSSIFSLFHFLYSHQSCPPLLPTPFLLTSPMAQARCCWNLRYGLGWLLAARNALYQGLSRPRSATPFGLRLTASRDPLARRPWQEILSLLLQEDETRAISAVPEKGVGQHVDVTWNPD